MYSTSSRWAWLVCNVHMYCDYCLLGDDDLARVVVVSVVAIDKVVVMVAGLDASLRDRSWCVPGRSL
jgi:hypothetical protein